MRPVSFAVMHVPERAEMLARVRERLDGRELIVEDSEHYGIWPTARRAWLAAEAAPWHMVLQDDMVPAVGFCEAVDTLAVRLPSDCALSVFAPCTDPLRPVITSHAPHGTMYEAPENSIPWGGSVVMRAELAAEFVLWADSYCVGWRPTADDLRLWAFLDYKEIRVLHTSPQLLEHIGWDCSASGGPAHEFRKGFGFVDDVTGIQWT